MKVNYGITIMQMEIYRMAMLASSHHDYLMQQLKQSYLARKAMYTIKQENS